MHSRGDTVCRCDRLRRGYWLSPHRIGLRKLRPERPQMEMMIQMPPDFSLPDFTTVANRLEAAALLTGVI